MTDAATSSVEAWFLGKSDEEIVGLEYGKRTYYPETVKRRDPADHSRIVETEVYLRVPDPLETVAARREAFKLVRARFEDPSITTGDQAVAAIGHETWEEIQMYCLMSEALFTREKEPRQYMLAEFLITEVKRGSAWDLYDRMRFYSKAEDPRISELTPAGLIKVVQTIAARRNCSPLVAIDGVTRDACIVAMASLLATSQTLPFSSPSSTTSTPESSPKTT